MPGRQWVPRFISDLLDGVTLSTDGTLATNSDTKIPTEKAVKTYFAANAGGGSFDLLSALTAAEISITGAAPATIGRMHVCSGVAADYTVTLPPVAGNGGKLIGFRMAAGLTKLVTLDGNAAELIDGQQTRVMWAGETAILMCDGAGWAKIAGKSRPLASQIDLMVANNTNILIANATITRIALNSDSTFTNMPAMADAAGGKLQVKRPGLYRSSADIAFTGGAANQLTQTRLYKNGVHIETSTGGYFYNPEVLAGVKYDKAISLAAGDYLELYCYRSGTGNLYIYGNAAARSATLQILEVPSW